jgi:hypothetical protein
LHVTCPAHIILLDLITLVISTYSSQVNGIALGYGLDNRWFESCERLGIFLFTIVSRAALGPIQHPILWVPGSLPLGVKRPGREADCSPPSSAKFKSAWIYTPTRPIRFHGTVQCFQTPTTYVLPFMWQNKFHTHTK